MKNKAIFLLLIIVGILGFGSQVFAQTGYSPVVSDQNLTTFQNTVLDIVLTASDEDGDDLTFNIISGPSGGSLGLTDNQANVGASDTAKVSYIPGLTFTGSDSFRFRVDDGHGGSDTGVINIVVEPVSRACSPEIDGWIQWWDIAYEPSSSFGGNHGDYHDPVASDDQHIYAGYVTEAGQTWVAMKDLSDLDQEWIRVVVDEQTTIDPHHRVPSIIVDGEGYIHIACDMHNSGWQYYISNEPNTIEAGFRDVSDQLPSGPSQTRYGTTYPRFAKDVQGRVIMSWRGWAFDESRISVYDPAVGDWMSHITLTKEDNFRVGKAAIGVQKGGTTIHTVWVGYHTSSGGSAKGHNLSYARSHDQGNTWEKNDGTLYQMPITSQTQEIIVPPALQDPYWIRCQVHLVVDSYDRPHIFFYGSGGNNPEMEHEFDVYHLTQDENGDWKEPYAFAHGGEQDERDGQWFDAAIDPNDVIYVLARNMDVFKTRDYGEHWEYFNLPAQPFKPGSDLMVGRVRLDQIYTKEKGGLLFYIDDEIKDGTELVGITCAENPFICAGPGDVNCNGMVDSSDILMVLNNWSKSPGEVSGYHDPIGDSKINGMDFGWVIKDWITQ